MTARTKPAPTSICSAGYATARFVLALAFAATISAGPTVAKAEKPIDALIACWRNTTLARAASSCEPPEAVVAATYGACLQQEVNWHNALLVAGGPFGAIMANNMFDRVKASAHNVLQTLVTRTRTENGLCRSPHP